MTIKQTATYTTADMDAFRDPNKINSHFGLPLPQAARVFSISLNAEGKSNVHQARFRRHYFGNTWAYRYIKKQHPDAWIWDERYRFNSALSIVRDPRMIKAQIEFIRLMGTDRLSKIRMKALALNLKSDSLTDGKPDLAVHFPSKTDLPWKFFEIKLPNDPLKPNQLGWLKVRTRSRG